jgi:two-component system nitrogen regulation sensor histidine kinase GlnL
MIDNILYELRTPVILINNNNIINYINAAGEEFFGYSSNIILGQKINILIQNDSPLLILLSRVRKNKSGLTEESLDISNINDQKRNVRIHIVPLPEDTNKIIIQISQLSVSETFQSQRVNSKISKSFSSMVDMLMHELKNPLAGIKGASQLLESDLKNQSNLVDLTQLIQIETDRINSLLNRMEHITNDNLKLNCEFLNIHKVLNHCRSVALNSFGVNIKFVVFYDPSLPKIFANRDLLIQIFLNIIKNSCEAIKENGEIIMKTSFNSNKKVAFTKDHIPIALPLQIEIIDNGLGIPNDLLPNIFDPFVSSKKSGKGLGLSIVASALNEIGAVIDVNSIPGHTKVCVNFPINNSY